MEPSTELANIEAENGERINALLKSGIQLQPGTFELIQLAGYLESLIRANGGEEALCNAKLANADRISELITELERMARKSKIVAP